MIIFMLFPEVSEIITIISSIHPVSGLGSFHFQGIIDFYFIFVQKMALLGQFLKNCEHDYFHFFSEVLGIITIILSYHPVLGPDSF